MKATTNESVITLDDNTNGVPKSQMLMRGISEGITVIANVLTGVLQSSEFRRRTGVNLETANFVMVCIPGIVGRIKNSYFMDVINLDNSKFIRSCKSMHSDDTPSGDIRFRFQSISLKADCTKSALH